MTDRKESMPNRIDQKITITVDTDDIENVIEFTRLNLDFLNKEEFGHIHESAVAVQKAIQSGRLAAWDKHNAKERTNQPH